MSWKERLENIKFTIKTGDGKEFFPLWKNGEKSKDFNISKYDFINVEGSFIDRKQPQANKYPLTFWFQGDDNIDQSNEFEASANDPRLWTVEHPFYGTIKGQPTNLKRNDTNYNVTEITVDFWESLTEDYPSSNISLKDGVRTKTNALNTTALAFTVENAVPAPADINNLKDLTPVIGGKFEPTLEDFNTYRAKVNKAFVSVDNLITDTETALQDFQEIINAPALFVDDLTNKIESYVDAYESMKDSISNLFSKYQFESTASSILAGMALSAINAQDSDFVTRDDIEAINNQIVSVYEDYLATIDSIQVSIYEIEDSWFPNLQIQLDLLDLITFTSNSLFLLSFNARQERTFELKNDSNLIILTHRFLGLDASDENIETFRRINNIKNKELYKVKQGRTIKYFV